MSTDTFLLIAIGIGVILLISFLVRSFMKFVLIGVVIYVLFHLGYIWGVGDLNEKLHLDKFFEPEASEKIQSTYGEFTQKREQFGVVKTDEVKKVIDDTIQKAVKEAGTKWDAIDKEALLNELKEKLKQYEEDVIKKAVQASIEELKKVNINGTELQTASSSTSQ